MPGTDRAALVTGPASARRELRLLEVPPELEARFARADAPPLILNGRLVDDATLSTEERTYAVRVVSQSNSLLLCTPGDDEQGNCNLRLHTNASELMELVPTPARVERLGALLGGGAEYAGEHAEGDARVQRLYTPREVRSVVQASERELAEALRALHVVELDGHLRRVEPAFLYAQLRVLLNQLDILACDADKVPCAPVCAALEAAGPTRKEVAHAIVTDWFATTPAPTEGHVALATQDIARFMGIQLLNETRRMPLLAFMEQWRSMLGEAAHSEAKLPLLQGYYLLHPAPASFATSSVHASVAEPEAGTLCAALSIQAFPHTGLSPVPATRFQELFTVRSQWVLEELVPFLAPLTPPAEPGKKSSPLDALLMKHARSFRGRWSRVHRAVLLEGAGPEAAAGGAGAGAPGKRTRQPDDCLLYQARVKYT